MQHLHIIERKGRFPGTILFLHGSSSSSRVFEPVMDTDKLPYNLISFDLPGHGRSFRSEDLEDYGMASFREAVIHVASKAEGKVLLAGNSFGGHLAIETAASFSKLSGLVIFGTPPLKKPLNLEEAYLPNPILATYFTENVSEEDIDKTLQEGVAVNSAIQVLKEDFQNCDPKIRKKLAEESALGSAFMDEFTIFKNLEVPKYIIRGDKDPTVNPEYLKSLSEVSPNCTLTDMENCGHYPTLEQPEIFMEHLQKIAAGTLQP